MEAFFYFRVSGIGQTVKLCVRSLASTKLLRKATKVSKPPIKIGINKNAFTEIA